MEAQNKQVVPKATVADLYAVDGKCELVNDRVVRMPPTGGRPSEAALQVVISLRAYGKSTGTGRAIADNCGFLVNLPGRRSFSPDAAFWTGAKPSMKFYEGAPVFAVEVRSEGDYGAAAEREMLAKRIDYFKAGTLVVWDIDLQAHEVVRAHTASEPHKPRGFRRSDMADAEPALPGWRMRVEDLFDW